MLEEDKFSHKLGFLLKKHVGPIFYKSAGILAGFISLIIVLSELTLYLNSDLFPFSILLSSIPNIYLINFVCILSLTYLLIAALSALFNIRIHGYYGLNSNHHTDSASLLFIGNFMSRLGFPICLNFLYIINTKSGTLLTFLNSSDTSYIFIFDFQNWFPIILLVLVLLNYFHVYSRILNYFGFATFEFQNEESKEFILNGKKILEKSYFLMKSIGR